MKLSLITLAAVFAVAQAGAGRPTFSVEVSDPSLPDGVGSLNLKGEYERDFSGVTGGVKYEYNSNHGRPSAVWVSTSTDLDDDTVLDARAEYDLGAKTTLVEATISRGDDSVSVDYDTGRNEAGPVKIVKTLDMNGRSVKLLPEFNVNDRTGEITIQAQVDDDNTTAEISFNQADDSASLEVSYDLDDSNTISPKVDLKSGDMSLRLNRKLENGGALEVTADQNSVDFEYENNWTVKGKFPINDGKSEVSFSRSIEL